MSTKHIYLTHGTQQIYALQLR